MTIKFAPGDQVILLSKIDCQWYRVMVEEIRGDGEVVVTHGSRHPNETVPKHELVDRLRQRTIHLEGLPVGWIGETHTQSHNHTIRTYSLIIACTRVHTHNHAHTHERTHP